MTELKNLKKPVKRSLLVSKNESKKGFPTDNAVHDHCYPGLQVQSTSSLDGKERKMEAKLKNSTEIDSLMDHSEASPYSLRDEADTVRANANERKCQISLIPVQVTESQRQFQTASDVNVMSAGVRGRVSQHPRAEMCEYHPQAVLHHPHQSPGRGKPNQPPGRG